MSKGYFLEQPENLDQFGEGARQLLQRDVCQCCQRHRRQGKEQWVFRGHKDATWNLETTLERSFERFRVPECKKTIVERRMIREFHRRLHQYSSNVPGADAFNELMGLMQHHGSPTRLLDFTYSPYVAAYFAFEEAEPDCEVAIWAINTDWCERKLCHRWPRLGDHYWSYQRFRGDEAFKALFTYPPRRKFVLNVSPYRLNERQAYQRGTFLCPGDVTAGFMDNLNAFTHQRALGRKVIKFTINTGRFGKARDAALEHLDRMNINRITLFPGLDGFAESFEARIPTLFLKQRWP